MKIRNLPVRAAASIVGTACILLAIAAAGFCPAAQAATVERGFLPLSDGTQLNYVLTLPDGPGPFPVALTYGPYQEGYVTTSNLPQIDIRAWTAAGYAHLSINFRGTGCSGGVFHPFDASQWGADGAEIVDWAARQSWSNGRVGMYGLSFPGTSQLVTAAFSHSGHLKAIAPWASFPDFYRDLAYPGGVFDSFVPLWIVIGREFVAIQGGGPGIEPVPACEINPLLYLGPNAAQALGDIQHPYYDDFYAQEPESYIGRVNVPVYGCVAWQDTTVRSRSFEMYENELSPDTTWIVGNNGGHDNCARAGGPVPPDGSTPLLKFFERYVKGVDNGWENTPHLVISHEVDSNNKAGWTTSFQTWAAPAKTIVPVSLFLHAGGLMDQNAPSGAEPADSYNFPAPTANTPADWAGLSPFNNPTVAGSSVTYTSPVLTDDAEFFGTGSVNLWLSSTASDTDVQVMLSEIRPDGQETFVQNGWLRMSQRKLDPAKSTALRPYQTHLEADAEPLQSGQAVLGRMELLPFNHVFRAGSAIRLSIDAPGNWFVPQPMRAVNSIQHSPDMASQLVLGWIPGGQAQSPLPACGSLLNQPCRSSAEPVPAGHMSIAGASAGGGAASGGGGAFDLAALLGSLLALRLRGKIQAESSNRSR
jgi:predicted acyl esterase